jgi:hypothetical protein
MLTESSLRFLLAFILFSNGSDSMLTFTSEAAK